MASIFINYRRADNAAGYSRTLAQRLRAEFGDDEVFRDIQSIPPGTAFADYIAERLAGCSVMLVLIGTQWIRAADTEGNRRLHDPEDWVRREVAAALARDGVLVVPVLVCGASLPSPGDLPADLQPLVQRNAFVMSDDDFEHDLEQLITALRRHLGLPEKPPSSPEPARAPSVFETISTIMRHAPELAQEMKPERPGLAQRMLRRVIGYVQFLLLVAIAVWIGYTQSDAFAAGVDRFFKRSGEMLRQLVQ